MFSASQKSAAAQIIAAIIINSTTVMTGLVIGWATPMVPRLLDEVGMTTDQVSWVLSIVGAGSIVGSICAGTVTDVIGRKYTLVFSLIPATIAFTILIFTLDFPNVLVSRILSGFSMSISLSVLPMYLGEISETKMRGLTNILTTTFMNLGTIYAFIIGPLLSSSMFALLCALPGVVFFFLMLLIPESPHYYLLKDNVEKARKSLNWLRGGKDVTAELTQLQQYISERRNNERGFLELFRKRSHRKAILCSTLLSTMTLMCGVLAIENYAHEIFAETGLNFSADLSVIILGVIFFLANLLSMFMIGVMGRKPLLFVSSILTCVFLALTGSYYQLKSGNYDVSDVAWIPLFGLIGYAISTNIGIVVIPFVVRAEIFPPNIKASANMLFTIYTGLLSIFTIKIYQILNDSYGLYSVLYFYAIVTFVLCIIVMLYMPETKGKSLSEIELLFENRSVSTLSLVEE